MAHLLKFIYKISETIIILFSLTTGFLINGCMRGKNGVNAVFDSLMLLFFSFMAYIPAKRAFWSVQRHGFHKNRRQYCILRIVCGILTIVNGITWQITVSVNPLHIIPETVSLLGLFWITGWFDYYTEIQKVKCTKYIIRRLCQITEK